MRYFFRQIQDSEKKITSPTGTTKPTPRNKIRSFLGPYHPILTVIKNRLK